MARIIYNRFLPFRRFYAINLCGLIFMRPGSKLTAAELQHELIHSRQQREMLYVFFFLWYFVEWLMRLCYYRNALAAYRNISFEREAYARMYITDYLQHRQCFAWKEFL